MAKHSPWFTRLLFVSVLALTCLVVQAGPGSTLARPGNSEAVIGQAAAVQNLSLSDTGLSFTLATPPVMPDGAGWLALAGLDARTSTPGAPSVPFYSTYIVLPPHASATVTVQADGVSEQTVPSVSPVPTGILPEGGDEVMLMTREVQEVAAADPILYHTDALYPARLYDLTAPMYLRDVRLVQLSLYPLQYNPAQNTLTHSAQLHVTITFDGADFSQVRPAPSYQDNHLTTIAALALNGSQAQNWRSLPQELEGGPTVLPVGQTAYKLAVSQNGIHEISYANLGLSGSYNPANIQMVYDGQPVAFEFVNRGGSANFDSANDAVRFYGWAFDGSRHDQQYVTDNIFWLWLTGSATNITSTTNPTGLPAATSFPESITAEQNNRYTSTFVPEELWFYNEPDAWYWDLWTKSSTPVTKTYTINTPNPVTSGGTITFTTELLSRGLNLSHTANTYLNYGTYGATYDATLTWSNNLNVNIVGTALDTALVNGTNQITIGTHSSGTSSRTYLLNRLTIDYQRLLIATGDQLIFNHLAGSHQYSIQEYSQNNPSNILVWNITNRHQPTRIPMTAGNVSGSGPYTYTFGSVNPAEARFIATTTANVINIASGDVSSYLVPNIEPATGQVDWLAVSYADFLPAANQLATHRQDALYGDYRTHVVNIQDIINQYGYGLETPSALHDYLTHALADWQVAPSYVVLVGDASADVRHIWVGNGAPSYWDPNQISYVNADMLIYDRYQGLVPSDHSYVLLAGGDILPDMAIGRLPVQSNAEGVVAVNKIIQYEQNHLSYLSSPSSYQWLRNILFAADAYDPNAGDFCYENEVTAAMLSAPFVTQEMCRGTGAGQYPDDASMQAAMKTAINDQGITLLNYRGHGAVDNWSGTLLSTATTNFWNNAGKPIISLSMDCLDAHFIFPGFEGLGETMMGQPVGTTGNVGSAGHWSSTGLGLTSEHNYLARGFYEGLLDYGLTAIGDAIIHGKLNYYQAGFHYSEMYSFTLHGDPALQLFRPAVSLDKTAQPTIIQPGQQVAFTLTVNNIGLYPSHLTITDTLPAGLSYVSHNSTVTTTVSTNGNAVVFTLEPPFGPGDSATITLTTLLDSGYTGPTTLINSATARGTGLEGAPGNETDTASVQVIFAEEFVYLPFMKR